MNGIFKMKEIVYLGLGSNLGNRKDNLLNAIDALSKRCGKIKDVSSIYETEAWGFNSDDKFLNMVISIATEIQPQELIKTCKNIEKTLGRKAKKGKGYESRIIDIDILHFGNKEIQTDTLIIPHPQIEKRNFVLLPLIEVFDDSENQHKKYKRRLKKLKDDKIEKFMDRSKLLSKKDVVADLS